jgi:hypothetical protein
LSSVATLQLQLRDFQQMRQLLLPTTLPSWLLFATQQQTQQRAPNTDGTGGHCHWRGRSRTKYLNSPELCVDQRQHKKCRDFSRIAMSTESPSLRQVDEAVCAVQPFRFVRECRST